jgi:hypothetical protein
MRTKSLALLVMFAGGATSVSAGPTTCETEEFSLWRGRPINALLEGELRALFQCVDRSTQLKYGLIDKTPCSWVMARSLTVGWGFSDFNNGDTYLSANDLAEGLARARFPYWTAIGRALRQESNNTAAARAQSGFPVIASWKTGGPTSNIALILPGGLAYSSAWALKVPRSASITLEDVNTSYVGCRLSNAIGGEAKKNVQYYVRDLAPF